MERRATWANRYAIFDEIASGAMATVYLGARLGRENRRRIVAVKKLSEEFAREQEFVNMFLDEARLASRIRHPNVVETFQVLRVPGSLAIVMELVVGVSLGQLLKTAHARGKPAPLPAVGALLVGALQGLHAAHEAKDEMGKPFGLVHRDVAPGNILVGGDGVARVIDFGIAKAAGRLQVTEAGMTRGNASYMAPEQLLGRKVDRRTDVYAAGAVLWEILVGRPLFPVSSDTGMLGKRASGLVVPSPPSSVNSRVPAHVDALVMKALESDPARRFETAEAMADAVAAALGTTGPTDAIPWVTELAAAKLDELGAKIREVERAFERGELDEGGGQASKDAGASAPLIVDAPNLDLAKPALPARRSTTPPPARGGPAQAPRVGPSRTPPLPPASGTAPAPTSPAVRFLLWGSLALIVVALGAKAVVALLAHSP